MDNYKRASQIKLRFSTPKGNLTTEQLWELSKVEIGDSLRLVKRLLKKSEVDDDLAFLETAEKTTSKEQLQFEILKDVYLTKKEEEAAATRAVQDKEFNQKILAIIAERQETDFTKEANSKSIDELRAMLR